MYQSNSGYGQYAPTSAYRQTVVQPQTPIMPLQQQPMLKGRPVSSLEEARATTIDFDGSVFFFPDLANKRIYTKQINMDGTASLNMYELQALPTAPTEGSNFVTREEFEKVLAELRQSLVQGASQQVQAQPQTQSQPAAKQAAPQFNF